MDILKDIQFFQLCRKRPKGEKKTTWVRRVPKANLEFQEKVKVIRIRAEKINQKLLTH